MNEIKQKLKILLIEDNEDDASLLLYQFKKNNIFADVNILDKLSEVGTAIKTTNPDIILSDYNLLNFTAFEVLQILKDTEKDIPFIIVSGAIGEETAVKAMRLGACDYIMKDNLHRLIPALERELKEAEIRKEKRKADEKLKYVASHDTLTNLLNRYEFENQVCNLNKNIINSKQDFFVFFISIEKTKMLAINDSCGYHGTDKLLQRLSSLILSKSPRESKVGRIGGFEFGILLSKINTDDAMKLAINLIRAVKDFRFLWEEKIYQLAINIGIVNINEKLNFNTSDIIRAADSASYIAKEKSDTGICLYQSDNYELSKRKREIEWITKIETALSEKRFQLFFQKIQALNNDDASHYEILLRLNEDGEIISPNEFIPAAEKYNLMIDIDRYVITTLFTKIAMNNLPSEIENNSFHINLSGQSFDKPDLLHFILKEMKDKNIDAKKIGFEVTETAAMSNINNALAIINGLKKEGCTISLDDFGSGLSSFSYLKDLPIDFLKIDGYFVKNILTSYLDLSIVDAIITIGKKLKLKVIAEYVENTEIMDKLIELGVDFVQGYGIHKPSPLKKE